MGIEEILESLDTIIGEIRYKEKRAFSKETLEVLHEIKNELVELYNIISED